MFKLLLKLAVVALVANAAWHSLTAYASFYKFKDAVQETAQFGNDKTIDQLKARVLELASSHDLPLAEDDVTVRRDNLHTYVDGSYVQTIELAPNFSRPWTFEFHVDTFSEAPITAPRR